MQSFASKMTYLKCVEVMSALLLVLCDRMCMLGHLRESLDIKGIVGRCDLFAWSHLTLLGYEVSLQKSHVLKPCFPANAAVWEDYRNFMMLDPAGRTVSLRHPLGGCTLSCPTPSHWPPWDDQLCSSVSSLSPCGASPHSTNGIANWWSTRKWCQSIFFLL